jgi:hypothetical protein
MRKRRVEKFFQLDVKIQELWLNLKIISIWEMLFDSLQNSMNFHIQREKFLNSDEKNF